MIINFKETVTWKVSHENYTKITTVISNSFILKRQKLKLQLASLAIGNYNWQNMNSFKFYWMDTFHGQNA